MTRGLQRGDVVVFIPQDTRGLRLEARLDGHKECRRAAARMFSELGLPEAALAVGLMRIDDYLTPQEIEDREQAP